MKTTSPMIDRSAAFSGLISSLFVLVAAAPLPGATAPDATPPEPKTHTLFMGADLEVQVNKDFCRVRDVAGEAFLVSANGKDRSVPMNESPVNLRVQQSLKLTPASATIANLKGERAYTPANDPVKKFMREQPGSNAQAMVARADGAYLVISNLAAAGGAASGGGASGPGGMPVASGEVKAAQNVAENAGTAMYAEGNNIGNYVSKMQGELAQELFDAMEVTFEVSCEKPLTDPYVLIIARYHEKDAKPVKSRNWIYAKALAPIDQKPRKIQVKAAGFPAGFVMEDFKVHLYDHGQELATNVADRRVPLTRDEAFQYVMIDYVSSHKDATLPPTPAMGKLPADLRSRLASGQLAPTLFVKVGKDGLPAESFVDAACSQKVTDPYLQSVVADIRFKPALEKGKAVEGIARLNFSDLSL